MGDRRILLKENPSFQVWKKNTGMPSIKIPMNITFRVH